MPKINIPNKPGNLIFSNTLLNDKANIIIIARLKAIKTLLNIIF